MKKITKIGTNEPLAEKKKLKVAAYCRVSTASDEQLISLEAQKAHYESHIRANDEWEYVGLYYDEGITGTKKDVRAGLLSMIADCEAGKIEFIITKSISRFARNTTDCLEMVRKLTDLGISIFFEKENINTGSMESELMLSILSSLAESESVSISENSKWSVQKRFQNGTFIISYPPYGYENDNGTMVIVPEQAEIVKEIIPRDLYMQVQEEMVRRANLRSGQNRKKRVYSSKYALSSIVYCSKCGDIYRRVVWNNRGKRSIVWRCCTRVEHGPGACNADAIHESELQNLVVRAINMALGQKDTMYDVLQRNVEAVLTGTDGISLDEIDTRLEELQKELLNVANAKGNYDSIVDEIYRLREAKQNAQVEGAEREGMKQRISEMQQFLAEQTQDITEYDEQLVRRLIEKITVYDEKVIVEFKSGTSVDIHR